MWNRRGDTGAAGVALERRRQRGQQEQLERRRGPREQAGRSTRECHLTLQARADGDLDARRTIGGRWDRGTGGHATSPTPCCIGHDVCISEWERSREYRLTRIGVSGDQTDVMTVNRSGKPYTAFQSAGRQCARRVSRAGTRQWLAVGRR